MSLLLKTRFVKQRKFYSEFDVYLVLLYIKTNFQCLCSTYMVCNGVSQSNVAGDIDTALRKFPNLENLAFKNQNLTTSQCQLQIAFLLALSLAVANRPPCVAVAKPPPFVAFFIVLLVCLSPLMIRVMSLEQHMVFLVFMSPFRIRLISSTSSRCPKNLDGLE